jgi:hypothetical protein
VTEDDQAAQLFLDVDITLLGAGAIPGGWSELRGTTIARIDFSVELSNRAKTLWKRDFSETQEVRVYYFLTSDMEKVMNRAYCRSLESLEDVLSSPEFLAAVSK